MQANISQATSSSEAWHSPAQKLPVRLKGVGPIMHLISIAGKHKIKVRVALHLMNGVLEEQVSSSHLYILFDLRD